MRALPLLAVAPLFVLAACDDDRLPGKGEGESCQSERECQRGLVCFERTCASSYPPSPTCTLPGSPTLVLGSPPAAIEPPPGTCVTAVREPVPVGEYVDLGEHRVGTTLSFDLPAGTSGFTLISQEVNDTAVPVIEFLGFLLPNSVVPTDVRAPGGTLFYSDTQAYPTSGPYSVVTGLLAYYGGLSPISGSFTVPNTAAGLDLARTEGELPPGTWTFTVNDWGMECLSVRGCSLGSDTGVYRTHVYARPGPIASTGKLDLEIYLATDPSGFLGNAAAAVTNPHLQRWVRSLGATFAKGGICLGTVTVRDLPDWARSRYAPGGVVDISGAGLGLSPAETPPGCDDLSQLFTVAVAQSRAVHVFLADELRDASTPSGFTVLGVDGSIPGPSGAPGTVNGGAVVGVFDLLGAEAFAGACSAAGEPNVSTCGADALAYITAHEAGHWLGLYHTTEFEGNTFDPLSDTATCACLACVPRTLRWGCAELEPRFTVQEVTNANCSGRTSRCGGGRNLMFWLFDDDFADGELTRQQGEVMRLNPAVR